MRLLSSMVPFTISGRQAGGHPNAAVRGELFSLRRGNWSASAVGERHWLVAAPGLPDWRWLPTRPSSSRLRQVTTHEPGQRPSRSTD